MNDLKNEDQLEQELRRLLRERAAMARPSPDARDAIRARVAERRSGRRIRQRIGAVAAAAAAVGGGIWLQSGSPATVGVASGGDDRPATTTTVVDPRPAPAPSADLPRLVLDGDGFAVEHLDEYESDPAVDEEGDVYTQVFRAASGGPAAPSFAIRSVAIGVAYGIGEDAPADAVEQVDVQGHVGYLVDRDGLSPSLGWRLPDGSAVHMKAIGMPGDALVEIANGLEPREDGYGWNVPVSSMPPVVEGEVTYGGARSAEIQYAARERGVRADVRVFQGNRLRFEDMLLDRADSATTYEPVEVRGFGGVMFGTGGSFAVLWHEGGVVGEVSLTMSRDEALATLATLREVPEQEWQALRP